MTGLSTRTSISFGCAFVAGKKRVPSPAAGKTALRIGLTVRAIVCVVYGVRAGRGTRGPRYNSAHMLDPALLRDNLEAVRTALQNRGLAMTAELEELASLETARRRLLP